jgi:general secretion pathway protein I
LRATPESALPAPASRRPRGRALHGGFTLIEVLVALIIVAFGMSAVFVALTSAANSTMRLREKSFAEWVGFNQLSTVRLNATTPIVGRSEGDATFAGIRWHCLQTVENTQVPGLLRVTIQVRYADAKGGGPAGSQSASASATTLSSSAANGAGLGATGTGADSSSASSRCIDPGAGAGNASAGSSSDTWLATVVGFYGLGPLVAAPIGVLAWDTATAASTPNGQGTPGGPTTPGGTTLPGSTPTPGGATPPAPAPVPRGAGLP